MEVFLYISVTFLVGVAAGFQGIYNTYEKDSPAVALTLPGLLYLVSRGGVPASFFLFLHAEKLIHGNLLLWALACGTGVEIVLRSKILIRQSHDKNGRVEELLRGPLDLLKWYESLLLENAAPVIGEKRKTFVEASLPPHDFDRICQNVIENIEAWPSEKARTAIQDTIKELQEKYELDLATADNPHTGEASLKQKYRLLLGYRLYNVVGRRGFKTLCLREY